MIINSNEIQNAIVNDRKKERNDITKNEKDERQQTHTDTHKQKKKRRDRQTDRKKKVKDEIRNRG